MKSSHPNQNTVFHLSEDLFSFPIISITCFINFYFFTTIIEHKYIFPVDHIIFILILCSNNIDYMCILSCVCIIMCVFSLELLTPTISLTYSRYPRSGAQQCCPTQPTSRGHHHKVCIVGENIIDTTKIQNDYGAIQSFKFPILR